MNGTARSAGSALTAFRKSNPLSSGMWTSEMIRSGIRSRALASALRTSGAVTTSNSRGTSRLLIRSRLAGVLSTTRTRAPWWALCLRGLAAGADPTAAGLGLLFTPRNCSICWTKLSGTIGLPMYYVTLLVEGFRIASVRCFAMDRHGSLASWSKLAR